MSAPPGKESFAGMLAGSLPASSCRLPVSDRAALLMLFLFVLFVVALSKYDLAGALAFAAIPTLMATASGIPLRPLIGRLLIASPFILFMAAGNLLFDRTPMATLAGLPISGGMVSAAVITIKSMATLTALLTLMACLPFHRFGAALSALGVPAPFVTQLLLVYRYSFLLAEEAAMMQKARDLRAFNGKGTGIAATAKLLGSLLVRTTTRGERIYRAMSARGFDHALTAVGATPLAAADIAAIAASALLFTLLQLLF